MWYEDEFWMKEMKKGFGIYREARNALRMYALHLENEMGGPVFPEV